MRARFAAPSATTSNSCRTTTRVSKRGVLRGLHYQISQPQGKLVRVVRGEVFDVAVDLRKSSPTFGQWVGCELGERDHRQMCGPPELFALFFFFPERAGVPSQREQYSPPG